MASSRFPALPRRAALAGLLLLGACGPTRLAPLQGPPRGRALLLRGLANMFSTGLNVLTAELRAAGYDARVHNHVEWRRLAAETEAEARAGTLPRPLAVMGHSFGADEAIRLAGRLGQVGVATDLLVTFDPTSVLEAPPGPLRVVNFHQALDPFGRAMHPGPGFAGLLENRLVEGESHLSIEKSARLHREVLALLEQMRPAPPAPRPPAAPSALPRPPRPPIRAG